MTAEITCGDTVTLLKRTIGNDKPMIFKNTGGAANFEFILGGNDSNVKYICSSLNGTLLYSVDGTGQTVINGPVFSKKTASAVLTGDVNGSGSYTAAQLLDGVITRNSGAGAKTDKMPTATTIVAAITNCQDNSSFQCIVRNLGSDAITLAQDDGNSVTLADTNLTIAQNKARLLQFVVTSASSNTVTAYIIGTPSLSA